MVGEKNIHGLLFSFHRDLTEHVNCFGFFFAPFMRYVKYRPADKSTQHGGGCQKLTIVTSRETSEFIFCMLSNPMHVFPLHCLNVSLLVTFLCCHFTSLRKTARVDMSGH
jgi:hypothetical protein